MTIDWLAVARETCDPAATADEDVSAAELALRERERAEDDRLHHVHLAGRCYPAACVICADERDAAEEEIDERADRERDAAEEEIDERADRERDAAEDVIDERITREAEAAEDEEYAALREDDA